MWRVFLHGTVLADGCVSPDLCLSSRGLWRPGVWRITASNVTRFRRNLHIVLLSDKVLYHLSMSYCLLPTPPVLASRELFMSADKHQQASNKIPPPLLWQDGSLMLLYALPLIVDELHPASLISYLQAHLQRARLEDSSPILPLADLLVHRLLYAKSCYQANRKFCCQVCFIQNKSLHCDAGVQS